MAVKQLNLSHMGPGARASEHEVAVRRVEKEVKLLPAPQPPAHRPLSGARRVCVRGLGFSGEVNGKTGSVFAP